MKLNRGVLAAVAMVVCVIAGTGCKHPGGDAGAPDDPMGGDPGQPSAQGSDDPGAPSGNDDPSMRRARRHRGGHHRGRGGHGGPRRNWRADPGNGGFDPQNPTPQPPQ